MEKQPVLRRFRVDMIADAIVSCTVEVQASDATEAEVIAPSHAGLWRLDSIPNVATISVVNVEDEEEFT